MIYTNGGDITVSIYTNNINQMIELSVKLLGLK